MTQPTEAVGGTNESVAPPTLEDRLSAALNTPERDEEEITTDEPLEPTEEAPTGEAEEVASEDEIEIEAEELPPIDAPVSWNAEEKAEFAKLPREVQETLTKREAQREKFVQTKAQEAAQAREAARQEAMQYAAQLQAETAQRLEKYAQQLTVQEPDPSLIVSDPQTYAQQMQAYRYYTAQREQAQREAGQARAEAQHYEAAVEQQEQQREIATLREQFPEYLDPASGPKLQEQLSATAKALGYPDELIGQARASDILAMKTAADWKAKAEKWDRAMAKQMERVRAGKDKLPPVAKPGAAKSPAAVKDSQYQADREAMRRGDPDATTRVLRHFMNN